MNTSILLIQSRQDNNHTIGTGFVIHQNSFGSYILTCAHVVEQVVEPTIDGFEVEIKECGSSETIDLALLYVKGMFKTPFELQQRNCDSRDVEIMGYSNFSKDKYQGKTREATILGERVTLKGIRDNSTYGAWQIVAKDENEIEHGNSGGPLICKKSGKVIAIVSNNAKGGTQGYAIAIEHLKDIWSEVPPFLFESDDESESPFVGLSAFGIEQSHLFFGRDRETNEIIEKLKKENLVAVVGDSGSGKSSVIKAGVIPKYLNGVLDDEEESAFYLIDTRPAKNPFNELSYSISKIAEEFRLDFKSINQMKKAIHSKSGEDVLNALEYIFKNEYANLLIYIDQFEELFTLCDDEVQKEFIEVLLYLLNNQTSNLKIKIVFTMRRDYYNLLSEYEEFFKLTQESKYTLRRMRNEQIKECIEEPLERTFIESEEISVFSKAVLQDMGDEASELTLLQIALTQTWQHKGEYNNKLLRTYHEIGEVSGALAKLADNTWQILSSIEKKILQYIFIRIIKSSDTGGVTRRLAERDEFSTEAWKLAQKLSSALDSQGTVASEKNAQLGRLLKIKGKEGKVLELTHEALIRQWPMYQIWLKKVSKDDLKRTHDYVIEQNKIYQAHGKKIKFRLRGYELERSKKLLSDEYREYLSKDEIEFIEMSLFYKRVGFGLLVIVFLVVVGLSGFLYILNSKLYDANKEVERTSTKLLTLTDSVVQHIIDTPKEKRSFELEYTIFNNVVNNFKSEKDNNKIAEIVAKACYGKGLVLTDVNKTEEAIQTYNEFIEYFRESNNPNVLEYVARAWYNKGKLLEKINKEDAKNIYQNLIDTFKDTKDSKLLKYVAQAWVNRNYLFLKDRKKRKALIREFIKYFKMRKEPQILKQMSNAYNSLAWLNLLDKEYSKAKENLTKGYKLNIMDDFIYYELNNAHYYLLSNQVTKAEEIYLKHRKELIGKEKWKIQVKKDIEVFKDNGIDSTYFDVILKLLEKDKL